MILTTVKNLTMPQKGKRLAFLEFRMENDAILSFGIKDSSFFIQVQDDAAEFEESLNSRTPSPETVRALSKAQYDLWTDEKPAATQTPPFSVSRKEDAGERVFSIDCDRDTLTVSVKRCSWLDDADEDQSMFTMPLSQCPAAMREILFAVARGMIIDNANDLAPSTPSTWREPERKVIAFPRARNTRTPDGPQ